MPTNATLWLILPKDLPLASRGVFEQPLHQFLDLLCDAVVVEGGADVLAGGDEVHTFFEGGRWRRLLRRGRRLRRVPGVEYR